MPQIPSPASLPDCSWATASAEPTPQAFPTILTGIVDALSTKVNKTSALLEVLCRYGIGGFAVLEGLTLTVSGSSLNVTVEKGLAAIDGIVALSSAAVYAVPASQATVNLWLKQDGTVTHTLTSTPPAGKCAFIGQVSTNGSGVTANSTEGVLYSRSGSLWRTLLSAPVDSLPAAYRVFTQVGADIYVWDGSAHKKITLT